MTRPANIKALHATAVGQRAIDGVPPIKEPQLPPRRAASLMACTTTRRAYWVIFKNTHNGWSWERNIPAVPKLDKKIHGTEPVVSSSDSDAPELKVGGEDWGSWCCPGCGQQQVNIDHGYIHLASCSCGIDCCRGAGNDPRNKPTCPNCGATIVRGRNIRQLLSNTTRGKLDLGDSRTLPGPDRRGIEG